MKKYRMILLLSSLLSTHITAQNTPRAEKIIVYKWIENGIVHYAKVPPRGIKNYILLNEQGMQIDEEKISDIPSSPNIQHAEINDINPENIIITSIERCNAAFYDLSILDSQENTEGIYTNDADGNPVKLSRAEIAAHRQKIEQLIEELCQDQ